MATKEKIFIPTYISDVNYSPARVQPRIFFYNGTKECETYFINQSGSSQGFERFPYFDNYSGNTTTTSSLSLLFNNEVAVYGDIPTASLYTEYWEKYVSLLYNPRTRLIKGSAIIPLAEYFNMELNDIVQFRGNYYHLRAINEYNLKTGECEIELLGPILEDRFDTEINCEFDFSAEIFNLDQDVQAFVQATGITNISVIDAINNFVVELKDNEIWDSIDIIYPFITDNFTGLETKFKYNLKNVNQYELDFINGVSLSLDGYVSNRETETYAKTGWSAQNSLVNLEEGSHIYLYHDSLNLNRGGDFGAASGFAGITAMFLQIAYDDGGLLANLFRPISFGSMFNRVNTAAGGGFMGNFTYNSTTTQFESRLYQNGVLIDSRIPPTSFPLAQTQWPIIEAYVGAVNWNDGIINPANGLSTVQSRTYRYVSAGKGLNETKALIYDNLIKQLQLDIDNAIGSNRNLVTV